MTVKITFDTANAAFADNYDAEVLQVMALCAERLKYNQGKSGAWSLWDSNGNRIGIIELKHE